MRYFASILCALALAASADVVPVYLICGQSNAGQLNGDTNYLPAAWQTAQTSILWRAQSNAWTTTRPSPWGVEVSMGRTIQGRLGGRVAMLNIYSNGASLYSDYATNGVAWRDLTNCYAAAMAALPAQGATGRLAGIYWIQGESDAMVTNSGQYAANLTNFVARLATATGSNAAFRIVRIGALPYTRPYSPVVRAAQTNAAALLGQTWVDSDGVPKNTTISSDYIHYDARGVVILGLRMAKDAETAP